MSETHDSATDTMRRYETDQDSGDADAGTNAAVNTNADPQPESNTQPEPAILPIPENAESETADNAGDVQEGRELREV